MNTMNDIRQKIIELIAIETGVNPSQIESFTTMSDAGVPSISQLEIVFALEEAFEITFPDEMGDPSLDGIVKTIQKLVDEKVAS